ncbi:hypothetical protein [Hydrotalea sp.]|uniref:hypothetical protein n=1 Tax=Hydrotalea sp. TaxID=2881279 RepID=UPI003D0EBF36
MFTRQPDYFDSETTYGTIRMKDTANQLIPFAIFHVASDSFSVKAAYPFLNLVSGQRVMIIYNTAKPNNAAVYRSWGYWFKWDEILGSILIALVFWGVAVLLNKNPVEESLREQMTIQEVTSKRKYD